jgi:small neutral amino acid transporter SnatA (MarC family)
VKAAIVGEADTLLFVVGVGLLVAGVWMVYAPAAFIVAGVVLAYAGWSLMTRKAAAEADER